MPAEVSSVVLKYSQRGAKSVQRADENVRDSIQRTSRVAREESGTISRWMERHQTALTVIGLAMMGLLAGIVRATPTLNAYLDSIRLAFSLMAYEIGEQLAPEMETLTDEVWELYEAFSSLDDKTKRVIAQAIALSGALAGIAFSLRAVARFLHPLWTLARALGVIAGLGFVKWLVDMATMAWKASGALTAMSGGSRVFNAAMLMLDVLIERFLQYPLARSLVKWGRAFIGVGARVLGAIVSVKALLVILAALIVYLGVVKGDWLDGWYDIATVTERVTNRINRIIGAWATVFTELYADILDVLEALTDENTSVIAALWDLFANLVTNTVVALAITVIGLFTNLFDSIILVGVSFVRGLLVILKGLVGGVIHAFERLRTVGPEIWEFLAKSIQTEVNTIVDAIPHSWHELADAVVNITSWFVNSVIELARKLWRVLIGASIFPDIVYGIIGLFKELDARALELMTGFVNGILRKASELYRGTSKQMSDLASTVAADATAIADSIDSMTSEAAQSFRTLSRDATSRVRTFTRNITRSFTALKHDATSTARSLARDASREFNSLARGAEQAVSTIKQDVTRGLGHLRSSARTWGVDVLDGFVDGLERTWRVGSAVRAIGRVVDDLSSWSYDAYSWGRDLMDEFADGLASRDWSVERTVRDIMDGIENIISFDRIANDRMARRWGSDMMHHFARGVAAETRAIERALPTPRSIGAGQGLQLAGGGTQTTTTTNVTIERGAIQLTGGYDTGSIDEGKLADEIADRFGTNLGGRTR